MVDDPSDRDAQGATDRPETDDAVASDDWELPTDGGSEGPDGPPGPNVPDPRSGPREALQWVTRTDSGPVVFAREILTSVVAVLAVGALLFAISGIWPPMVAVESGSMEPNLERGDLVFVMDAERFSPDYATGDSGVVTAAVGEEHDYRSIGGYGDVVIYHPNGDPNRKPVIHRAHFWVEKGENWLPKADPAYVSGSDCGAVPNCPAPHAGFITKGDNPATNDYYDQTRGISGPVKPQWIEGTAEFKIPWLGWVRLTFSEMQTGQSSLGAVSW